MSNILTNNINARSGNRITIGKAGDIVSIAGTLSYEDVTSVDSVGVITARSGIDVPDDQRIDLGDNEDFQISHDGTTSILDGRFHPIEIRHQSEVHIKCVDDGTVELYHNNNKKLETTSAGLTIHEDTDKTISFTGGIGEIDNVTGFQALNTAGSSLVPFGIRATDIRFADSGAERMRVDSSGRISIGATSVRTNWNDSSLAPKLFIEGNGDDESTSVCIISNSGATNGTNRAAALILARSKGTTVGSNTVCDDNTAVGMIEFKGNDGTNFTTAAKIMCRVGGNTGTDDMPGELLFMTTADGASSPTTRMEITPNGKVMIATDSTQGGHSLSVRGDDLTPFCLRRNGNNGGVASFMKESNFVGSIVVNTTSTTYNTSSDYRLKENIINISDGISRVKQLEPKRFNFTIDTDKTVDGFLAHEAATVVPEAVTGEYNAVDEDNNPVYQQIDQSKLVPLLTAALKEAITKIETLETKVAALEAN